MATCPNINLDSWKSLVASRGEDMSYYLWDKYEGNVPESEYTPQTKPGVTELFESNPELANAVYEALGFKQRNQVGENSFNTVVNFDLNKIRSVSGKLGEQGATSDGIRDLLKYVGVDLTNVNTESIKAMADYLRSNPSERNKVLDLLKKEPIKLSQLPDGSYDLKDGNHRATILYYSGVESIPAIITDNTNTPRVKEEYTGPFGGAVSPTQETITLQQKQQAQQLYSQYLDQIFPDSKVKDIVYHGSNIDFSKQTFKRDWIGNFKGVYFYFKNSGLFGKQSYKFDNPSLINIVKPETSYDKLQELISSTEKFAKTLWNLETNAAQSKTGKVYHGSYLMVESVDNTKSNIKYYERVNDNWEEINNETAENLIAKNSVNGDGILIDNNQAVVFEPEQIHILGGKQDIENFAKFVKNSKSGNVRDMENYMNSKSLDYIIDKLIQSGKIEKKC